MLARNSAFDDINRLSKALTNQSYIRGSARAKRSLSLKARTIEDRRGNRLRYVRDINTRAKDEHVAIRIDVRYKEVQDIAHRRLRGS